MSDMGSMQDFRQSVAEGQPIVAFDFDGTLTIRDSFTEFLRWRAGPGNWALGLVKLAPAVAAYIVRHSLYRDPPVILAPPPSSPRP